MKNNNSVILDSIEDPSIKDSRLHPKSTSHFVMARENDKTRYDPSKIESKWPTSAKASAGKQDIYQPNKFEKKWQEKWKEENLYKFRLDLSKPKYYPLVELPYPSGDLHIGHWFSFATADVHARTARMMGKNVFFTNGFDAFGLPAENAAIKRGIHPKDWTYSNIETMTKQFETMGTMIDWSHEAIACDPEYYRWNQWIFIKMYEKGLVYRGKMLGNWCPKDMTVLANEHVENGKCWRCGTEVVQKEIEQWFIKLTAYADELIWPNEKEDVSSRHPREGEDQSKEDSRLRGNDSKSEVSSVDWPTSVRTAQNQWIGRKEGVKITHHVIDSDITFESFSAYPAWSWADRYIVIAPEHPLVTELVKGTSQEKEVMDFVAQMEKESEMDRKETKEKLGVFTGKYAKDPFGGPDMPIWLANFALMNFGTGIIRCSGHDERDLEFAQKYGITTAETVDKRPSGSPATPHDGIMSGILKDSGPFTGRDVWEVVPEVIDWIEQQGIGKRHINYHIHDWSISRQRYWGTPVPMVHCEKDGLVPVELSNLPIELPYDVDFQPKGEPPLASNKEWLKTTCPTCGGPAERDPETLDTFFDSSWYFYRYMNPQYEKGPFDPQDAKNLMPVDIYFGGAEHTLGHTLYARFFTKFFKDIGLVNFDEFAKRRVQHGVILGTDGNRMSKSKGNVVNPDDVVKEYGADATRMYLCFMMPYEATAPWDSKGIWGVYKFLKKVWEMQYEVHSSQFIVDSNSTKNHEPITNNLSNKDLYMMHTTIKKVADDVMSTKFNTAVSAMMIWLNHLETKDKVSMDEYETLLKLLAPFAPHMTEEIWQRLFIRHPELDSGSTQEEKEMLKQVQHDEWSIHQQSWPQIDNSYLQASEVVIVVQVNGKVRDNFTVEAEKAQNKEEIIEIAKKLEKITKNLEGKNIKQIIYVPAKILNFVVV